MATNNPPHWLDQSSHDFLDAYNTRNDTACSSLVAHIFVFRKSEFLSIEETVSDTGHYTVPIATMPGSTQNNATTIRNGVISELGQLMSSTKLQRLLRTIQFMDYFVDEPVLASSTSSPSTLNILIVTTIDPELSDESEELYWIHSDSAMSTPVSGQGSGMTSNDVVEAVARYRFRAQKSTVKLEHHPEDADVAHTRILEAIIAVHRITSGAKGSWSGSILEREAGGSSFLLLYQRTQAQLDANNDVPPTWSFPGSTFARLGRWIDGQIQWTHSTLEERRELMEQVKRRDGRLDVEWR